MYSVQYSEKQYNVISQKCNFHGEPASVELHLSFLEECSILQFTVGSNVFAYMCTVHSSQFTVYNAQCAEHNAQSTVHSSQFTVHSLQFTVYSSQCAEHSGATNLCQHTNPTDHHQAAPKPTHLHQMTPLMIIIIIIIVIIINIVIIDIAIIATIIIIITTFITFTAR